MRGERIVHGDKELLEKLGRNDLCPCGSTRRFKKCCMRSGRYDGSPRDHYFQVIGFESGPRLLAAVPTWRFFIRDLRKGCRRGSPSNRARRYEHARESRAPHSVSNNCLDSCGSAQEL